MTDATVLRAEALAIGYRRARRAAVAIASDLSFSLRAGELVCLLGPNGAGKSTLMRTLARLQPSLRGRIWLEDRPLETLRPGQLARRLSVVLTDRVDVGAMSGHGLVSLGRHPYTDWAGTLSERDQRVVKWALHAVRARALADRPLAEMSDGERQKIFIARALAQEPRVMLLDEPTAFLDLPRRVEVMDLLRRLARENRQAILLSTHDLDLALRNADRLWLLSAGGQLYFGAPEDLILNGAFERVFSAEGVTFDRHRGSFHTPQEICGRLLLRGEGVAAFWARRALERVGFAVEPVLTNRRGGASNGTGGLSVESARASAWRAGAQADEISDGGALPQPQNAAARRDKTSPNGGIDAETGAARARAAPIVSVGLQGGGPIYTLEMGGRTEKFKSLDALTRNLRRNGAEGGTDAKTDKDLYAQR